jgi:hypothetical protein
MKTKHIHFGKMLFYRQDQNLISYFYVKVRFYLIFITKSKLIAIALFLWKKIICKFKQYSFFHFFDALKKKKKKEIYMYIKKKVIKVKGVK